MIELGSKLKKISSCIREQLSKTKQEISYNFNPLSATNQARDTIAYEEALTYALTSDSIQNIAITGPYGSGKSSMIKTFDSRNKGKFKFLYISLATFGEGNEEPSQENIEKSILQQMLYAEDSETLKYSAYPRIENPKKLFGNSMLLVIWGVSFILIYFSENIFFKKKISEWNITIDKEFLLLFVIFAVFICISIYLITKLIEFLYKNPVRNISLGKGELSAETQPLSEASFLNRHTAEILYFFEVAKYTVVVIEDLDRFKNTEIFVKLREINQLINIKKNRVPIKFIYAVKDSLFLGIDRVKFFDFIIPIIPVLNTLNSYEKIVELTKNFGLENSRLSKEIGLYIYDLRLIYNIFNEFIIYEKKILTSKNFKKEKLLAILIYKNIYPQDFENLHSDKDKCIFCKILDKKKTYLESEKVRLGTEIERKEDSLLQDSDNESIREEIEDLRKQQLTIFQQKLKDIPNENTIYMEAGLDKLEKDKGLVLKFLLREEYIDDDYIFYISNIHEGATSLNDMAFMQSIRSGTTELLGFDYKLDDPEGICKKTQWIRDEDFASNAVFNIDLIEHLLSDKGDGKQKDTAISFIASNISESKDFIGNYVQASRTNIDRFIKSLSSVSRSWILELLDSNFADKLVTFYLNNLDSVDQKVKERLALYVNSNIRIINIHEDKFELLKELNIKIPDIRKLKGKENLIKFIYDNSLYEINVKNINYFAEAILGLDSTILESSNYTSLMKKADSSIFIYIEQNIQQYNDSVIIKLPNNSNEEEGAVIRYLSSENLRREDKINFISKQSNLIINDLSKIPTDIWEECLSKNKILADWGNLELYLNSIYVPDKDNDEIINNILDSQYELISEANYSKRGNPPDGYHYLHRYIFDNDNLSDRAYNKLISKISSHWTYLPEINKTKQKFLIEHKKVQLEIGTLPPDTELAAKYLEVNYQSYKDNKSNYTLSVPIKISLLNSTEISIANKYDLCKEISLDEVNESQALLIVMRDLLIKNGKNNPLYLGTIDSTIIGRIIKNVDKVQNQLEILNKVIKVIKDSSIAKKILMEVFGSTSNQLNLPANNDSQELMKSLQDLTIISSFKNKESSKNINDKRVIGYYKKNIN